MTAVATYLRRIAAVEPIDGTQHGHELEEALDECHRLANEALDSAEALIDPREIIGPGEIRALAGGVTRATFKHWREGRNLQGAGAFPLPFKTVSGVDLYDRRAIQAWLAAHGT